MNLSNNKKKIALTILLIIFIYILLNIISIYNYSFIDEKRKADVGIVLGAATYNGKVSKVYEERLNHAVYLYNNGYISKIIVTGGTARGSNISDAKAASNYLISKGIHQNDILTENSSTITEENLEFSKRIMKMNGYKDALIISDPLHMKRAMLLADRLGIKAYSSPTKTTRYKSFRTKIPFLLRETFFYISYKWLGFFVN